MKHLYFLLLLFPLLIGCNSNMKLQGTVVFSDDGSPVADCMVIFTDGTHNSRATTDKNGNYTVMSESVNDGIPKGTYQVFINGAITQAEGTEALVSQIDDKYRSVDTSGLTFEADGSVKRFDIKLDRAAHR